MPSDTQTESPERQSFYVDVEDQPWQQTRWPGIEIKVLMEDKATGLTTSLTRFAPGAELPDHMHVGIEQSYVLEGSLVDHEGACTAGNFVWRKAGSLKLDELLTRSYPIEEINQAYDDLQSGATLRSVVTF